MLSRELRSCLSETKKKRVFCFIPSTRVTVLLPREAQLCFSECHGPTQKRKKNAFFIFFFHKRHDFASMRGTIVLSRESRPCLSEREKNTRFCFFSFVRGTVVLSRESLLCLSETEKNAFSVFFLSRELRFCFHERHGCDFARGTDVPLSERKKETVLLVRFFRPVFFVKKKFVKTYQYGI